MNREIGTRPTMRLIYEFPEGEEILHGGIFDNKFIILTSVGVYEFNENEEVVKIELMDKEK